MRPSALEFLGTLAGGLVHEIKNPLSTVRINLTLLKEDLQTLLPDEGSLRHRIELLEGEVSRLDAVLSDFMRYAGMRDLDRRRHDLAVVVAEMVAFVGPGFERDSIALELDLEPQPVDIDVGLFKQALLNLLINAQDALEHGGTVTVTSAVDRNRVRLTVADDGCGIAQSEQERVFDVYYSGSKKGSGLGLPTARRLLEEHGGGLELESTEGQGTRVHLWLPKP